MPTYLFVLLLIAAYLTVGFTVCRVLGPGYWSRKQHLPVSSHTGASQNDYELLLALSPIAWPVFLVIELGLRLATATNPRVLEDRVQARLRAVELLERETAAAREQSELTFDTRVAKELA